MTAIDFEAVNAVPTIATDQPDEAARLTQTIMPTANAYVFTNDATKAQYIIQAREK